MIFKEKIDPFTKGTTELKKNDKGEPELIPGKVCEIQYLIGYVVNAKMKFDIKFPTFEKQKKMTKTDEEFMINNFLNCQNLLKPYAFERFSPSEITDLFKQLNITCFVDPDYCPQLKEVEANAREYNLNKV